VVAGSWIRLALNYVFVGRVIVQHLIVIFNVLLFSVDN